MELGDPACATGCHFHVQVMGEDDEGVFPKSVPVPRLPSLFVTAPAVVEHALGEIFQDAWVRAVVENRDAATRWKSIQKERFERLLNWHLRTLAQSCTPTPWMAIKLAKPKSDTFLK